MADNNLALGRHDGPDIFAEDDPLAELARIVGYEDRSARPSAQAAAPRREPEFNLEDELMREFERYDAPRLDPANDIGPAVVAGSARQPVETPVIETTQPVAVAHAMPVFETPAPVDRNPPLQHLPFDLTAGAPAMPIQPRAAFSHADLVAELESSLAPAVQRQPMQDEAVSADVTVPADVAAPSEAAPTARPADKGYKPGFRMPIANFQRTDTPARETYRPSPIEPAQVAVAAAAVAPTEAVKPVAVETNESIWSSLERELTGEGFAPLAMPAVETRAVEPSQDMQTPVSLVAQTMPEPTVSAAAIQEQALPVDTASVGREAVLTATVAQTPVFSQREEMIRHTDRISAQKPVIVDQADKLAPTDADLIDDDFELALDDLDLDFSELSEPEPVAPARSIPGAAPVAPVQAAYQNERPVVSQAAAYSAPPSHVPAHAPAPADVPPFAASSGTVDAEQFDPTLIAEGEEHVESMFEVDVPELPVEEPVVLPKHDADFDIDLDAELANLLQASPVAAPSLTRGSAATDNSAQARPTMSRATPTTAVPVAVAEPAAAVAKPSYDADLDDFERALEEDFRRSLSNPLPQGAGATDDRDDGYAAPAVARQVRWGAPAAIVGVLLMGGLSAYAYYASGLPGKAESGQPLVIAADKEPVKIAPENPGGKTVPNQDKAVYERVAGGSSDAPRQETLISSNEEPMDVVQRTLTSDNLPLQGEEEAQIEGLDTQDPRLLPQQANALPQGEQPVSVMPRKVRTMVVRPDGTLVEQEVSAPVAAIQQAAVPAQPVASQKVPAQPALAEPTVAPKTAHIAPATPAPMSAPAEPSEPAELVTASAPARPVPAARPAEQPVNVVASVSERGNVQQAVPAPQQVASIAAGGYFIQVASLPSQADAQKSYQNLSNKFGTVIGGRGVDIKAAEIAGKGTFYRVRIPAGGKDEAVQLCERYRSAGGSCLVTR
ncbi:SPOR domain-containing protein [Neorhizobium sp. NPDC001467]|uniref:SPOR domain-containing protein n=1 Tax=Neorhizobium sp. NPDC001467 TaxID=3390595 RepID=UPI003D00F4F0